MVCICDNPTTYHVDLGDVCEDCEEFVIREDEY